MVEILRFEYDRTSFEDDEDLKDMKFFFRKKNFRFLLLRFLGNQTEGRCVRTQNLHFTIQKALKWNFQTESYSFSLKKIQGKSTDQNQQQEEGKKFGIFIGETDSNAHRLSEKVMELNALPENLTESLSEKPSSFRYPVQNKEEPAEKI